MVHELRVLVNILFKEYGLKTILIVVMMLLAAALEMISLGLVIPFVAAIIQPDKIPTEVVSLLGRLDIFDSWVTTLSLVFGVGVFASTTIRTLLLVILSKFSFSVGSFLASSMYRAFLLQDYSKSLSYNSADFSSAIMIKTNRVVVNIVLPLLNIISAVIIIMFVAVFSYIYMPNEIFIFFGFIGAFYVIFLRLFKTILIDKGRVINSETSALNRHINDTFFGFREIVIADMQNSVSRDFDTRITRYNGSQAAVNVLSTVPRYILEGLIIVLTIIGVWLWAQDVQDREKIVPLVAAVVFGAQRLMPLAQQIYSGMAVMRSGADALTDVVDFIESYQVSVRERLITPPAQDLDGACKNLRFANSIELRDVSFAYGENQIFSNVCLELKKGEVVGLVGDSGSGKSTLIDIILGLKRPSKGDVYIDGIRLTEDNKRSWFSKVASVPQKVFLLDASIEENIIFGSMKSDFDQKLFRESVECADIYEVVERLKSDQVMLGDGGKVLSGGQQQRVALARAFYRNADFIVLDEATSGLDLATEERVLKKMRDFFPDKTILMITHRPGSLDICNSVITVSNNSVDMVRWFSGKHG